MSQIENIQSFLLEMSEMFESANKLINDFESENPGARVVLTAFAGVDTDVDFEGGEVPRVTALLADSVEDLEVSFSYISQSFIDDLDDFDFQFFLN